MHYRLYCIVLLIGLISFHFTGGQNLPNQVFSITNSSNTQVSFSLSFGNRQWIETLDPYFTRQYTTTPTQPYQIVLTTANKPPLRFNLSPPNKYTILWDDRLKQWVIGISGRFY